jgi:O-antigen/teichoic acid export membrane protein
MGVTAPPPLHTLAVKSAAWYGATRLWGQAVSWGVTVLLARLLMPADYGLFAIALSVLAVLELLQEFGLGTAIVQRQDLTRSQINAIFWVVTVTSVLLTATTFAVAGPVSQFYAEPRLTWTLRILCLTFLLNSLGMVPYNLLTKAIDLRHRSLAEALGTAASAVVALGLAWLGYGVWSLVLGHLARALVLNASMAFFAGWCPGLEVSFRGMRSVIAFGVRIAATHLVGTFSPATTTFILARLLGAPAVGLFTMAQSLSEGPHRISTAIISQLSLPVFSKVQGDTALLGRYYLKISKYLAVVSLPIQVGLVLVASDLVPLLLSSAWEAMITPFQVFCFESMLVTLTLTSAPLLVARGRPDVLLRGSIISLAGLTLAAAIGAPFGLVGVAVARVIIMVPLRSTIFFPGLREIGMASRVFVLNLIPAVASAAVMAGVVLLVQHSVAASLGHWERVLLAAVAGVLSYLPVVLFLDPTLRREAKAARHELFPAYSGRIVEP